MCETLVGGEVLCCLSFLRGIGNQVTKAKKEGEGEDAHFLYAVIQRDFEKKVSRRRLFSTASSELKRLSEIKITLNNPA